MQFPLEFKFSILKLFDIWNLLFGIYAARRRGFTVITAFVRIEMMKLKEKLTREFVSSTLREDRKLISALIADLNDKGKSIAGEIRCRSYPSLAEFFNAHDRGESEFVQIEGRSDRIGNLFLIKSCMLHDLKIGLLDSSGQLPTWYDAIEKKYLEIYPKKTAILNPLCIVCQVVRESAAGSIRAGGKPLTVVHLACRSELTGKRVRSRDGIELAIKKMPPEAGFSGEKLEKLLDEYQCAYFVWQK